jgi:hypothetical protein
MAYTTCNIMENVALIVPEDNMKTHRYGVSLRGSVKVDLNESGRGTRPPTRTGIDLRMKMRQIWSWRKTNFPINKDMPFIRVTRAILHCPFGNFDHILNAPLGRSPYFPPRKLRIIEYPSISFFLDLLEDENL